MKNIKLLFTIVLLALTASVGWSQSLTTLFASNNGGSAGGAVYFDITVGPNALDITALDINTADAGAFTVTVYAVAGTHVGNQGNAGFWGAPVTTGSGTGAGLNNPSNATLNANVSLNANTTYAIALTLDASHGHDYTNGNGANQMFSNADMTINLGSASNVPFAGGIFTPRVWNGTVYYQTGAPPPPPPGGGGCETVVSGDTPASWTDGTTGAVASLVAATAAVPPGATVTSVEVSLDMSHSWAGDIELDLVSPDNTTIPLFDQSCGSQDNFTVTFTDTGGPPPCTGCSTTFGGHENCMGSATCATVNGMVAPLSALGALTGETANGNWTLEVRDLVGGDGGCVENFSVEVCYAGGGAPCVPFDLAGPYCDPCLASGGTSSLACGAGPNSLIQGIDVSGLPGPSFVNAVTYYSDTQGTNPTGVDVHIYCGPAGTPPSVLAGGVPLYSEIGITVSAANDGTCVAVPLTTPPTVDASCGTMWIEIVAQTGRFVYTPASPNCNGEAPNGNDSWLVAPACGITSATAFSAVGFTFLDITYSATFEEVSCGSNCDLVLVSVTPSTGVTCGNTGTIDIVATSSAPPIVYSIGGPVSQTNGTGNFSGLPAGTYVISVVDQAGCATTATVTLDADVTPPTITCPPNMTLTCFEGVPAPIDNVADWLAAGGTYNDDCPANGVTFINVNTTNGGTNCPGDALIVTRTYTVFDEAGNAATCTQTFTYLESGAGPVITSILPTCYKFCASLANPMDTDITYTTDCSFDGVVTIAGPQVIGPENCPGTQYVYTYTVMDNCGRVSAPAQRAFIIGNDGPTIQCPATNLILECGDPNNTDYVNEHLSQVSANTSCELGYNITNNYFGNPNSTQCFSSTVVTFTVTDDCQRTATCTTIVTIEDNTAPEITSIYVDGVCNEAICGSNLQFWFANWKSKVADGLSATDNCDSFVSWTTSPNSPNPNQDCPDGTAETAVTWIATDNCGNTSGITYSFYVIPADSPAPSGNIAGILATEETETVENVAVTLQGNNAEELFTTAADGIYSFASLALDQNYSVTPYLNEDPLNGVSSFDLVLISKHILEIQTLDSPYKMIAADINKSGAISTMDLLALRKLILHVDEEFQGNTSWRFIESAFIFPDATNPFATLFPEAVNINGLTANEQHDFVAVKVGDVNNSAVANAVAGADDRTVVGDLVFNVADQRLNKGETYEVTFNATNFEAIHGYQFSLNFDQRALEFDAVRSGELTDLNESNFGLTLLEEGVITTSWTNQSAQSLTRDAAVFHLSFTAKANVLLSEVMSISSRYTKAEAYNGNLDLMDVQVRFDNSSIANEFRLYQNTPNPFKATTVIGFDLPAASAATLTIYDVSGRMLTQVDGNFEKGYNQVSIEKSDLQASGVVYYRLMTNEFEGIKKMMIVD